MQKKKQMLELLIVEDEKATANFIRKIITDRCEKITVAGMAHTVASAVEQIKLQKPDIVILDVELGDGTAFDFLQQVEYQSFITIFLTAYQGYALQAIKFSAFDYILKPFKPKELLDALNNAVEFVKADTEVRRISVNTLLENLADSGKQSKKIILRTGSDIHVARISEVVYCKADASYTHFVLLNNEKITVTSSLKEYEKMFEEFGFVRSHHSFLVNVAHIKRYHKTGQPFLEMTNGEQLPVSLRNKERIAAIFKEV